MIKGVKNNYMKKKELEHNIIYFLCCLALYAIVAFICAIIPVNMEAEGSIYFHMAGRTIAMCFFITVIVRSRLISRLNIFRMEDELVEQIFTFLCSALGTAIVALVWKNKDFGTLTEDLKINVPTLYFVFAWISTVIGTSINAHKYYGLQKAKSLPIKDVSVYMLLWSIPVLIISFIFKNSMNFINIINNKYILILYILPFAYIRVVVWLFSKFNKKHSWKINDMNEYGESNCADLYNQVFKTEFHLVIFIVLSIIFKYCISVPDYTILILALIMSGIATFIVNSGIYGVRFSQGPDGKVYKVRPVSTSSSNWYQKSLEKEEKKASFDYRTTEYKDEFGNVVGRATTTTYSDKYGEIATTEYKDNMGNSTGKSTTYKW